LPTISAKWLSPSEVTVAEEARCQSRPRTGASELTAKLTAEPPDASGCRWASADGPPEMSGQGGRQRTPPQEPDQTTDRMPARDHGAGLAPPGRPGPYSHPYSQARGHRPIWVDGGGRGQGCEQDRRTSVDIHGRPWPIL
jgi:hypothetical protein